MKFYWQTMLFILGLMLLAACGGKQSETAVDISDVDLSDLQTLPDIVDVQTVSEIKDREGVIVIDVREQWEYDEGHIPGVTLIPMGEVASRLDEIPTDQEVILTCRSGNRSGQITAFLQEQGYDNVHNMDGGILAWEAAGLPVEQ